MINKLYISIKEILFELTTHVGLKAFFVGIYMYFTTLFGPQVVQAIIALGILCGLDFIMAMISTQKTGKQITSGKFPKKAIDFFIYLIIIYAFGLLNQTLLGKYNIFDDGIIVWFVAGEVISILEHAGELGYNIPIKYLKNLKKIREK